MQNDIIVRESNEITSDTINDEGILIPYVAADVKGKKKIRSDCKFCKCEFKDEAEKLFASQKSPNYYAIHTFLIGKNVDVSYPGVRHHLIYHFQTIQHQEWLLEYAADIKEWLKMPTNKVFALKKRMAMLDKTMMEIASQSEGLKMDEKRKSAETVKKIADTLLAYEVKLEEYQESLKPVTVIVNQLKIIISDEMSHGGSRETKKVLVNVLERLEESVGDMIIGEQQ
jgi:hypothetical protein